MKKLNMNVTLFLLITSLIITSQTKIYASSKQVTFDVPVMIDGFAWKKVPRYITVTCSIRNPSKGILSKPLGTGSDKRPYRPSPTKKIHNAYVTVRAHSGKSFHKGDAWDCFAKKPNSTDGGRSKLAVGGKL